MHLALPTKPPAPSCMYNLYALLFACMTSFPFLPVSFLSPPIALFFSNVKPPHVYLYYALLYRAVTLLPGNPVAFFCFFYSCQYKFIFLLNYPQMRCRTLTLTLTLPQTLSYIMQYVISLNMTFEIKFVFLCFLPPPG